MHLEKINSKDLLFTNEIEDDRTNTYLQLYDYDWMNYNIITRFRTKELGTLDIRFSYFGMTTSIMEITQTLNDISEKATYEYPTKIFEKYIIRFLKKHIQSWNDKYAFNGEEEVIDFFNEVLEKGTKSTKS